MSIKFHFQKKVVLINRRALKYFVADIFKKEGKDLGKLDYIFCDDPKILNINQDFLNHNYYTDIITFNMTEPGISKVIGEIYISVDTVESNAQNFRTTFKNELVRVMFHGVLHLCGYKDKTLKEKSLMRLKEDFYLNKYFNDY